MQPYAEMSTEELQELRKQLSAQYKEFQGKDLRLDMSRGKPSVEQLDLSMGMMDVLSSSDAADFPGSLYAVHVRHFIIYDHGKVVFS